jgi:CheY-like chemotaxis protein
MPAKILLVSPRPERWRQFNRLLAEALDASIVSAPSGGAALALAGAIGPLAAIVDPPLPDMQGPEFLRRLLALDAMIHTALVSDRPPDRFHQETEGLGILVQLPADPGEEDAAHLARAIRRLEGAA